MKNNIIRFTFIIVLASIVNCVSYRAQMSKGKLGIEKARKNIIIDFVNY